MSRPARRTCIACREAAERGALIRLVRSPTGELVVDRRGRLPGRGAWVHPTAHCVGVVEARPASVRRALRDPELVTDGLLASVRSVTLRAIEDGLSQASAAGELVGGHDRLVDALRAGRVVTVVMSSDASPRTAEAVRAAAADVVVVPIPMTKGALGRRTGRAPLAAVGVGSGVASAHLRAQLARWSRLS